MDILEQLLVLEKQAAGLVAAAEVEAGQRKAAARVAAQAAQAAALKQAAADAAAALDAERARLEAERVVRNEAHRARLAAMTVRADGTRGGRAPIPGRRRMSRTSRYAYILAKIYGILARSFVGENYRDILRLQIRHRAVRPPLPRRAPRSARVPAHRRSRAPGG